MNISKLDFNLYKTFVAVYDNKNIARVAEGLIHTPSAVGQRIKELERQLGLKLFTPHARGVQPTKEADELYTLIKDAVATLANTEKTIKDFNAASTVVMRIGSSSSIASVQIKDFLSDFIVRYPNVKLEIHYRSREELANMLAKRDLDVVVHRIPYPPTKYRLVIDELCDHPRAFFASRTFMAKHQISNALKKAELEKLR